MSGISDALEAGTRNAAGDLVPNDCANGDIIIAKLEEVFEADSFSSSFYREINHWAMFPDTSSRPIPSLEIYLASIDQEAMPTNVLRTEMEIFFGLRVDRRWFFEPLVGFECSFESLVAQLDRVLWVNSTLTDTFQGGAISLALSMQIGSRAVFPDLLDDKSPAAILQVSRIFNLDEHTLGQIQDLR